MEDAAYQGFLDIALCSPTHGLTFCLASHRIQFQQIDIQVLCLWVVFRGVFTRRGQYSPSQITLD